MQGSRTNRTQPRAAAGTTPTKPPRRALLADDGGDRDHSDRNGDHDGDNDVERYSDDVEPTQERVDTKMARGQLGVYSIHNKRASIPPTGIGTA